MGALVVIAFFLAVAFGAKYLFAAASILCGSKSCLHEFGDLCGPEDDWAYWQRQREQNEWDKKNEERPQL